MRNFNKKTMMCWLSFVALLFCAIPTMAQGKKEVKEMLTSSVQKVSMRKSEGNTVNATSSTRRINKLKRANDAGGTATDTFLDISKYASFDEAGWNTEETETFYKYTEENGISWLTMPVYSAMDAAYNGYQNWIQYQGIDGTVYSFVDDSWEATYPFAGGEYYFGDLSQRSYGVITTDDYYYNNVEQTITFYVTNCSAIQLYGENSGANSTYPTSIRVYECTKNSDETLTDGTTIVAQDQNSETRVFFTLSVNDLDVTKYYKVVAGVYRGCFYEIAFQTKTTPVISAEPKTVTMNTKVDTSVSQKVTVRGVNLNTNVNFTLSDANSVFSLDKQYVTRAKAQSDEGAEFTITFNPTEEGEFTGTVTLSSTGAEDVIVYINGVAQNGGTALDAYLDIAKYATIDGAGYNNSYVNPLYKYTENKNDKVAWLTLPVYGAASSVVYSPKAQKWIKTSFTSLGNSSGYMADATWNSSDIYLGSNVYFTSGTTARAIYGSGNGKNAAKTPRTVTFYVTNTTAVKLLGLNSSSNQQSNYPSRLYIYECTENADGTLTEGTTDLANQSNGTKNATFNFSKTGLDASKIYKVEASVTRGYLYEIGFQTPLPSSEINATSQEFSGANKQLNFETIIGESQTKSFTVTGVDLEGDVTATLTDANGVFTLSTTTITKAQAEAQGGYTVDVTFNSATAGTFTGSITLSSQNAESVTVNLNGVAHAPELIADPEELTFDTTPGTPVTGTFDVLGDYLKGDVTLTLNDASGVFSISPATISKADAEEGATVTVTFSPTANGEYTGTVVLTSEGVEPVTVTLNGTAYPDGFPVTIGTYGVTTLYVDFPLIIPYDTYDPDILGVYYVKEISDGEAKFKRLENDIPANTAVAIQGNANTADTPAYIFPRNKGAVTELPTENLLLGSLNKTSTAAALEAYFAPEPAPADAIVMTLGMGTKGYLGFYKYSGTELKANKAYMIYNPSGSGVNSLSIGGIEGDDFTGIKEVGLTQEGAWYTVQGTRLNSKPRQSGIYIHNGKAVVVK